MRIQLAFGLALLLLVGCPGKEELKGSPAQPAKTTSPTMRALTTKLSRPYPLKQISYEEFPEVAAAYLDASLNDLMSGGVYAPKDMTLAYMSMVPGCQIGRDAILKEVEVSGEMLSPSLVSAYMATDPENCLKYIQRQVNAGQTGFVQSVGPSKEVNLWVLEHINISPDDPGFGVLLLESILGLNLDPTPFLPNLRTLIASDDYLNGARAAGFLMSQGIATLEEKQVIIDCLKEDDLMKFVGGIEGLKLTGDPAFAEELVPIIAQAELGELDFSVEPDMKIAFSAYGLTSLGGEQAKKLRLRLLESNSPLIRVEAAFGEFMQGNQSPWNKLVESGDISQDDILAALKPDDAWHPDLLPYYLELADSEITHNRIIVIEHMLRYKDYADNKVVEQILNKLIDDEEEIIRERTWLNLSTLCPEQFHEKALEVVQDEDEHPKVRLVAALCAMQPTVNRINGLN